MALGVFELLVHVALGTEAVHPLLNVFDSPIFRDAGVKAGLSQIVDSITAVALR